MPFLVPLDGPSRLVLIPLEKPVVHLGAKDDNDVVIKLTGVSRKHARVVRDGDTWLVEDLDSSTFVLMGGKPVKRAPLEHRAQFSLGDAARFIFLEAPDDALVAQLKGAGEVPGAAPEAPLTGVAAAAVGKLRDLESLLEIGASINSSLEPQEVLESILSKSLNLTGAERGFIMLLEDGALVPRVSVNMGLEDGEEATFSSSFARKVIERGETIVSTNVAEDPRYRSASIIAHNIYAIMCAPLVAKSQTIGCLYVDKRKALETFSPELASIFGAVAHQAALAIHNARMNEALRRSLAETEVLYQVSRTLNEGQDVDTVLRTCLARGRTFLKAERASLMLLDETGERLVTRLVDGAGPDDAPPASVPVDETIPGRVAQDGMGRIVQRLMCAPLKADNRVIGVLSMNNPEGGAAFTAQDLNVLNSLASVAAVAIVKSRVERERIQQAKLSKQVEDARQVQQLLLPKVLPFVPGFDFSALYVPAGKVGGDYYDVLALNERKVALLVADVSGHDIASSMIMVSGRNLVKTYSREDPTPREVLARTSATLTEDVKSQWFITMFYGVLDLQTRILVYANAGNQPPVVVRADGRCEVLPGDGFPLGLMDGATYDEHSVQLEVGDLLLAFTDGLVEAQDASKQLYEMERLQVSIARHRGRPLREMVTGLHEDVLAFTGGTALQDDFTLLAMETVKPRVELHFTFDSRLVDVPRELERVMKFARDEAGFVDTSDVFLGVSAALNNAIAHGNRFDPGRRVFVSASPAGGRLSVTVQDEGPGFDAAAAMKHPKRGGLASIKGASEKVAFNAAGNAITMEFARG